MNENVQEIKKENRALKITKIVVNVIFYMIIVLLLLFSIANIQAKGEYDIPNLFGKGFTTVSSESMNGSEKDSFSTKDLLFVRVVNDSNRNKLLSNLEIGDIITFKYYVSSEGTYVLNTHRIVDIIYRSDGLIDHFITQGDVVASDETYKYVSGSDTNDSSKYEEVQTYDVKGIYISKWSGAGKLVKFAQTQVGFLVCIVLPVAIFFIVELVIVILNLNKVREEKNKEKTAAELEKFKAEQQAILEQEKERIRAEILAEQQAQNENK